MATEVDSQMGIDGIETCYLLRPVPAGSTHAVMPNPLANDLAGILSR